MKPLNQNHAFSDMERPLAGALSSQLQLAAQLVEFGSDIVLVVGENGQVHHSKFINKNYDRYRLGQMVGHKLTDFVTIESIEKVKRGLRHSTQSTPGTKIQINHPAKGEADLPIRYGVHRTGDSPFLLFVGQDLTPQMAAQQQLLQTQMVLESEFKTLQRHEKRYRTAFERSPTAQMILNANARIILEVNETATNLLKVDHIQQNSLVRQLFETDSAEQISNLAANALQDGSNPEIDNLKLVSSAETLHMTLVPVREATQTVVYASFWPADEIGRKPTYHASKGSSSEQQNPRVKNSHHADNISAEERAITPRSLTENELGFTDLIGKVPMKKLINESLEVVEKICIEAALVKTKNNRASAADMLGLSRQSLYIKLRKYGLEDFRPR